MFTARKTGFVAALAAAAFAFGVVAAPSAAAAPVQAATFSPLLGNSGLGTGSASGSLVFETITVSTNVAEPGVTRFGADSWCICEIVWTNQDTGATGSKPVGNRALIDPNYNLAVTGSGRITATAVVPYGTTFIAGRANWVVP